jgi:hypothetical protein
MQKEVKNAAKKVAKMEKDMQKSVQKMANAVPQKTIQQVAQTAKAVSSSKGIIGSVADAVWSIFKNHS